MFNASWFGIGFNYGSLRISGDSRRYVVRWGEGAPEVWRTDADDDGDPFSTTAPGHAYNSDGTYIVQITQSGEALPPVRLRAFMYANATNDLAIGGNALDEMMVGGSGADMLRGKGGRDTIAGNDGNDRLYGDDGDDFLLGGQGEDMVYGGEGGDLIGGNEAADRLYGNGGGDFIYGDAGDDVLNGDEGDDYLSGGAGVDRLFGGAGADSFVFAPYFVDEQPVASDRDYDLVGDFEQGTDRLDVFQWFAGGFDFIGTDRFSRDGTAEVRFEFRGSTTFVFGDVDGNGAADFGFRVAGSVALQASDFGIFAM